MINNIKLTNFRIFKDFFLTIDKNLVIIYGENACGKTTLLETIYFISTSKSFKTRHLKELFTFDNNYLSAVINTNKEYKITLEDDKINFYLNDRKYDKLDFISRLKVVTYIKEDYKAIKGNLSDRRKFINSAISMLDKNYLYKFLEYKKFLKERNNLLKIEKVNLKLLSAFDETNALLLYELYKIKIDFYHKINNKLNEISNILGFEKYQLYFEEYKSLSDIKYQIIRSRDKDLELKTTTFGLHRENINFYINNLDAKVYASEGQIKSLVLCFKLALADLIKQKNDEVVVLLDDLFAEIDQIRQNNILNYLNDYQTFITTTEITNVDELILNKAQLVLIEREDS